MADTTANPAMQITVTTTKTSKLKSILQIIEAAAVAGLPIFLSLNHNPETAVEVETGVGLAAVAIQGLTGSQPLG